MIFHSYVNVYQRVMVFMADLFKFRGIPSPQLGTQFVWSDLRLPPTQKVAPMLIDFSSTDLSENVVYPWPPSLVLLIRQSLHPMAISLGVYPIFRHTQMSGSHQLFFSRGLGTPIFQDHVDQSVENPPAESC